MLEDILIISMILFKQEKYEDAELYCERGLKIFEKVLNETIQKLRQRDKI